MREKIFANHKKCILYGKGYKEYGRKLKVGEEIFENEYLRVTVSPENGTFSIHDKVGEKVLVKDGRIVVRDDVRQVISGKQLEELPEIPIKPEKVVVEEDRPIRGTLRILYSCDRDCLRDMEVELSLAVGQRNLRET